MRLKFFFISLLVFAIPMVLFAQEADLGEITVLSPIEDARLDQTASVKVTKPEESAVRSTTEAFEKISSVRVKRYGSADDASTLSIRGCPSNQVGIYYDGAPLTGGSASGIDFSLTPPQNIRRIEIYKGGAPEQAADSSPGGAIFLYSPERPKEFNIKFGHSYGSFNTYHGILQITQPREKSWWLGSVEFAHSDGDFTFLDNKGTRSNSGDDEWVKRKNNDFNYANLLLKYGWENGSWKVSAANTVLLKDKGIPGMGSFQSTSSRLNTKRDIAVINASYKDIHLNTFFDINNDRFKDPQGQIGLGPQDNDDFTYRWGEELSQKFHQLKHNQIFVSLSHRGEYYLPHNNLGVRAAGNSSHRHQAGIVAGDVITFFSDRVILDPSIRFTFILNDLADSIVNFTNDRKDYQISAKFGAKFRLISDLYMKGNFYRGFRNPSFTELFGDRGSFVGNPRLSPEESYNFDIGLAYENRELAKVDRLSIETAYFRNYSNNLVQFLQTSQFTAKPQNLAKTIIQGIEFSSKIDYLSHLSHGISYTYQDARDASDLVTSGKILPGRPRHDLWVDSSVYNKFGRATVEYNFMAGYFLDSQNLLEVTSRNIVNISITATPFKWLAASFNIKNLLNDRIVDVIGFPLPGRSYWGSVTFKI